MRLVAVLALGACRAGSRFAEVSPAALLEQDAVERVVVTSTLGEAPNRVLVRALNASGAAVPSARFDGITLDGSPVPVEFDGYGYGSVEIDDPGHATLLGGDAAAEAWTIGSTWPAPPLDPVWETGTTSPDQTVAVTRGMLASEGDTLWWAGDGAPPHAVLTADGPILGLRATNLDVDGVLDAIAWTSSTLYLLKGRSNGGMAWAGGFQAAGLSIAGADAGDLSGDQLPDVAIAWVDSGGIGTLDIWEGRGLFDYEPAEPLTTSGTPTGLVVADNTAEGLAQVTVLQDGGDWGRYIHGADLRYMPIGPHAPTDVIKLPKGSVILPTGDINDDQGSEIVLATPRSPSVGRNFWFVDVRTDALACATGGNEVAQCGTEYLPIQNQSGAYYAIGDGNGDFLDDPFFLLDTRVLTAVMWDPDKTEGNFGKAHVLDVPTYAPFDVGDLDLDGELDVVLAGGPLWWTWHGHGLHDVENYWEERKIPSAFVREAMSGPFALFDLDGDPSTIEIVGFFSDSGQTDLRVYQYTPGVGRASQIGHVTLDGQGAPDDLAVCGTDVYVAIGGAVDRIALDDPTRPAIAASIGGSATRVDCGTGPGGSQVAVLDSGNIRFRTRAALEAVGQPLDAVDVVDLALGDLGGGPEVHTCTDPGCSVVFWPVGYFATTDSLGTTLTDRNGDTTRTPGTGQLSVGDIDRDGTRDLLSLDPVTGLVALHHEVDGSLAPARLFRLPAGSTGPLAGADGDLDHQSDLWFVDPDGNLVHTTSAPVATTTP